MTTSRCIVAGLLLSLAPFAVAASDATSAPRDPKGPPPSPLVAALDTDRDHIVSAAELAQAPTVLATLDQDGDGNVSAAELRPTPPADAPTPPADANGAPPAPPRGPGGDPLMLALDADSDGALSAAEIANAATSLAALDADKDGQLSGEELRPLPPPRS